MEILLPIRIRICTVVLRRSGARLSMRGNQKPCGYYSTDRSIKLQAGCYPMVTLYCGETKLIVVRGSGGASAARRRPPSSPGAQCPAGYNRNPTRFPDSMVDYGTQTKFERHRSHFADCSKWSRNSWSLLLVDLMWPSGKFSDTKCLQWAPKSATTSDSNQAPISTRPAWAPSTSQSTARAGWYRAPKCVRSGPKMMLKLPCVALTWLKNSSNDDGLIMERGTERFFAMMSYIAARHGVMPAIYETGSQNLGENRLEHQMKLRAGSF